MKVCFSKQGYVWYTYVSLLCSESISMTRPPGSDASSQGACVRLAVRLSTNKWSYSQDPIGIDEC